jgi:hypothetical protein
MYTPTTKVACTAIKWMLAEAEGSVNLEVIPRLLAANMHRSQTIHNRHVSGLQKLNELPAQQIAEILSSPEWIRIAALRDPVARAFSAWENRIFMRAPGRVGAEFDSTPDVLTDGCINMTASFALFAESLQQHTDAFMLDHHFVPQSQVVRKAAINYDMLVRVDQPGGDGDVLRPQLLELQQHALAVHVVDGQQDLNEPVHDLVLLEQHTPCCR